jgi:osmotically-inducible protein OsmY
MGGVRTPIERVRAALGAEPRVGLHAIHLAISDGVLTMAGVVAEVAAKKLALERAAAVPGVHHIVDRIRIQPARAMTDADVRDHLCRSLLDEPALRRVSVRQRDGRLTRVLREAGTAVVDVEVVDGVVTLSGAVPGLAHKRLAGVLAWWVPGTRDVVNGLEVIPAERDSDDDMADAVRIALEKDPLVDASGIHASVRGAAVTLAGAVSSAEQREMAEADAWYVFGVDAVTNRLEVRPGR